MKIKCKKKENLFNQFIAAQHSVLKSPQMMSDQRCLRSYTRKRPCLNSKIETLRDRNKNVINNLKY